MIAQLFKLMWNSKRNHSLLIIEIFVSFLVLFAVFSMFFYQYNNYKVPQGFDNENVWVIFFENVNSKWSDLETNEEQLLNRIRAFEEVEAVCQTSEMGLFTMGTRSTDLYYEDIEDGADILEGDADYSDLLNIPIQEGRWFGEEDKTSKYTPIVINDYLKKAFFGNDKAIGKILRNGRDSEENLRKVVGVIDNFKYKGDFHETTGIFFEPVHDDGYSVLIKVKSGADAAFEAKLSKGIAQVLKGWQIQIDYLSERRSEINKTVLIPGIVLLVMCSFLIFNVVLGLFGILWQNINKRKGEIGTRRAMGATQGLITGQFIGEVVVIATFALIIGCFFAIQFPLMNLFGLENNVYLKAIFMSILMIYLLVIVCAFYPSWQASKIHPAVALHAD